MNPLPLLMEEMRLTTCYHLLSIKTYKKLWIFSISTGAGFLPSTVPPIKLLIDNTIQVRLPLKMFQPKNNASEKSSFAKMQNSKTPLFVARAGCGKKWGKGVYNYQ